jgi:hypothetical protein
MRYCSLDGRDIKADDPVVYDPTWGFIHKEADMPDIGPHTLMQRDQSWKEQDVARADLVEDKTAQRDQSWKEQDVARAVTVSRQDADRTAEIASLAAIQAAYIDVAKGSLDRAVKRAEFLVAVEGAIGTLYTGLLGLVFGKEAFAQAAAAKPLPVLALAPVTFVGIALVLSAFYMSFMRRKTIKRVLLPSGIGGSTAEARLRTFFDWTFTGVLQRAWALRTSVVSLGLAIMLLPLPFIAVLSGSQNLDDIVKGAFAVLAAWLLVEGGIWAGIGTTTSDEAGPLSGTQSD